MHLRGGFMAAAGVTAVTAALVAALLLPGAFSAHAVPRAPGQPAPSITKTTTITVAPTHTVTVTPTATHTATPTPTPAAPVRGNISIAKSGPATVLPGGTVTYTLRVTNHGPGARPIVFADVPSDDLTITGRPRGCALFGRNLICAILSLAAGASRTVTVTARAGAGTAAGMAVDDCALATSLIPESDYADNHSCVQVIAGAAPPSPPPPSRPAADVAITKSGPAAAAPGGTVRYTLTVANHGAVTAGDVTVGDEFPADLTVTGVPAGCTLAGPSLTCAAGTLAAGHSRSFTVTARVSGHAAAGSEIENCAAAESTTPDSHLADNAACAHTVVSPLPPSVPVTG